MSGVFKDIIEPGDDGESFEMEEGAFDTSTETRASFVVRCLNAAANLYGILAEDEFLAIYNNYAKSHPAPVSDPLDADELQRIVELANESSEAASPGEDVEDDVFFDFWEDPKSGGRFIISYIVGIPESDETTWQYYPEKVERIRGSFMKVPLKIVPERVFMCYTDPMFCEETEAIDEIARILSRGHDIYADDNFSIMDSATIESELRCGGPSMENALYVLDRDQVSNDWEYCRLVECLKRMVNETRSWYYRGRNRLELVEEGIWTELPELHAPTYEEWKSAFDVDDDDYDDGNDSFDDFIDVLALPRPETPEEPFDFRKVKDAAWRAKTIRDYDDVRQLTGDFIREVVVPNLSRERRDAAAKRLGFTKEEMTGPNAMTLSIVVGDFAVMMDDQSGSPAIMDVLGKKDELIGWQQFAAGYYEKYRYTWMEVLSVKSGFGVKCHDLLEDRDIFLMEKSFSANPMAKGMTICAGIAPMGEVNIILGAMHPANFDNPATILKIVLTHLGLPTDPPVRLSIHDQARFAAETIRRINAVGRLDTVDYSCP